MSSDLFKTSTRTKKPLHKLFGILYGPPGAGKSTGIVGMPGAVILDTEQGIADNFDGIPVLDARSWPDVEASVQALIAAEGIEVAVVDTFSRAYQYCRKHIMAERGWATEADGGDFGKGYGVIRGEFARVFNPLFEAHEAGKFGLWIVTHAQKVTLTKPTGDLTFIEPDIEATKVKEDIQRVAKMILCYEAEQTKTGVRHVLYAQNDGYHTSKDKTGRMPAKLVIPTITGSMNERAVGVFNAINNAYEGDN